MRIFGFLDQKRSKTIQILSQNFDCYGVIKEFVVAVAFLVRRTFEPGGPRVAHVFALKCNVQTVQALAAHS